MMARVSDSVSFDIQARRVSADKNRMGFAFRLISSVFLVFGLSAPGVCAQEAVPERAVELQNTSVQIPPTKDHPSEELFVSQAEWATSAEPNPAELDALESTYRETQAPVYFYEIEDEPGKARKPASLSFRSIKDRLTARGIPFEVISLPRKSWDKIADEMSALGSWVLNFSKVVRANYVPPIPEQVATGIVMIAYRVGVSSAFWFSFPGMSKGVAASLTLLQTMVTAVFKIYGVTIDRVYRANVQDLNGANAQPDQVLMRRAKFNFFMTLLMGILSGELDWRRMGFGAVRAVANSIVGVPGDTFLGNYCYNVFLHNEDGSKPTRHQQLLNLAYGMQIFFLFAPITIADLTGHGKLIADLHIYKLTTTIPLLITAYLATILPLKLAPEKTIRVLEAEMRFLGALKQKVVIGPAKKIGSFVKAAKAACREALKGRDPACKP